MPSRYYIRNFTSPHYYHVYNRGSRKLDIFTDKNDYQTFLEIVSYYNNYPTGKALSILNRTNNKNKIYNQKQFQNNITYKVPNLVSKNSFLITAFCLMPNHFHFIFHQIGPSDRTNNITNFMRRISITYSLFYKEKYESSGALFEGKYKNILVDNDLQLLTLSRYIHRNPIEILSSRKDLALYNFSSYPSYLGRKKYDFLQFEEVAKLFSKNFTQKYKSFVESKISNEKKIEHLKLE